MECTKRCHGQVLHHVSLGFTIRIVRGFQVSACSFRKITTNGARGITLMQITHFEASNKDYGFYADDFIQIYYIRGQNSHSSVSEIQIKLSLTGKLCVRI